MQYLVSLIDGHQPLRLVAPNKREALKLRSRLIAEDLHFAKRATGWARVNMGLDVWFDHAVWQSVGVTVRGLNHVK